MQVDVDVLAALAEQYGVTNLPTSVSLVDGKQEGEALVGAINVDTLRQHLQKLSGYK